MPNNISDETGAHPTEEGEHGIALTEGVVNHENPGIAAAPTEGAPENPTLPTAGATDSVDGAGEALAEAPQPPENGPPPASPAPEVVEGSENHSHNYISFSYFLIDHKRFFKLILATA